MKHKLILIILIILLIQVCKKALAQDIWVNSLPLHYHPSFAGNTEQLRIATNNSLRFTLLF